MHIIPIEYRALCAKTDRTDKYRWLPLWMHMTDTAGVMEYLCRHWMDESTRAAIGINDKEELIKYCKFLGMTHDLGKATTLFQYQISRNNPDLMEKLENNGWVIKTKNLNEGCTRHALAGEQILLLLGVPESTALIVGAHHGKPSGNGKGDRKNLAQYGWNYRTEESSDGIWTCFWKYWLSYSLVCSGYERVADIPEVRKPAQVILSGLLSMADWIASNTSYFPLIDIEDVPDENTYPIRIEKGINKLNLNEWAEWKKCILTKEDFEERFGFSPNAMQASVIGIILGCTSPGIIIIEGPMGSGKTEASLSAIEICAKKSGAGGFFYGLPTQATADGIFPRLLRWSMEISAGDTHTMRLVHGAAGYNEDYLSLVNGGDAENMTCDEGGLIAHEWYSGAKKALLPDYVVGTVDQLLMADLKQRYVSLRHLGISGKVAVIDECHAYDAYTNTYLKGILEWLGAYGIPAILLSATLPAAKRKELLMAYTGEDAHNNTLIHDCRAYPLLTWSDHDGIHQKALPNEGSRHLDVGIKWDDGTRLADDLKDVLKDGGAAGIIVNTVRRAQQIYETLSSTLDDKKFLLVHAQMLMPDRIEKERILTACTGKKSGKSDRSIIVIGTQVLEQSLDIDFDILYTDLCPMDLLLQRIGRLFRHTVHDPVRPARLKTPVCHVLCGTGPELEKGACSIYGEYLLMRTKALLPGTVRIPDSIPELVQDTYNYEEDFCLSGNMYESAKKEHFRKIENKQKKAKVYQLGSPGPHRKYSRRYTIRGMLDRDVEERDIKADAAVRDGGETIDVLLLMLDDDGNVRYLPWRNGGECVPCHCVPSEADCREIARQRLRLPRRFCHDRVIDQTIAELDHIYDTYFTEWKESAWLGSEMILLLDSCLETNLCGIHIKYTYEQGLICGREDRK